MAELITSPQNPRIKNVVKLQEKASERKAQGLMVVEGAKEVEMALGKGFELICLFECRELGRHPGIFPSINLHFEVSKEVFGKMAYREKSDGILALFRPKGGSLKDLRLSSNPFILVLEGVEKPGNLGAIFRTADGAGADAVILCDPKADIWNPNAIRSSVGCIFSVSAAVCSTQECMDFLRENRISAFPASPEGAIPYYEADFSNGCAIILGTEHEGLSPLWRNSSFQPVSIPMKGINDSLNVSVAAGIISYEVVRQRENRPSFLQNSH